jgi:outer membrane autotransporter protein
MLANNNSVATDIQPTLPSDKWGMFVRGNAIIGDQRGSTERLGYNFTNTGITMGMDYRLTPSAIAGIILGVNTAQAKIDDDGSKVKMDGASIGAYATYYKGGVFLEGLLGYGLNKYDNTRRIVLPGIDRTASSDPRGELFSAYSGTGIDLPMGKWIMTPTVSFQYTRLMVNDYTETGADSLNLHVEKRTISSLQGNIGAKLAYVWETGMARIMPNVHASYLREFSNNNQAVVAQLAQLGIPFTAETVSPEKNFLMAGAGLMSDFKNGLFIYLSYQAQIGQGNYLAHSIYTGLRILF